MPILTWNANFMCFSFSKGMTYFSKNASKQSRRVLMHLSGFKIPLADAQFFKKLLIRTFLLPDVKFHIKYQTLCIVMTVLLWDKSYSILVINMQSHKIFLEIQMCSLGFLNAAVILNILRMLKANSPSLLGSTLIQIY